MQVGLDFGTTNSVISYWDEKAQEPQVFSFNNNTYTPSLVLWDRFAEDYSGIGTEAKKKWKVNTEKLKLFQKFKILLPHTDKNHWASKGWDNEMGKTPTEITRFFINTLLRDSSNSFEANVGEITNLVVSMPEVWQKDHIWNKGAESLQSIISDLNLPLQQLVSEPLAAVAYYINKSQLKEGEERKVLVCDMGGGTFDVSWCKAKHDTIEVISFEGDDNDRAGMYHLQQIIRNALKKYDKTLNETSPEFIQLVWDIETFLTGDRDQAALEKQIKQFKESPKKYNFNYQTINGYKIELKDIFLAFKEVNEAIDLVLSKLEQKYMIRSFDHLLLVGGFSRYFSVREAIFDYLGTSKDDERVQIVSKDEGYLSIAKGAALLAANEVKIVEKYPHSVFIQANPGELGIKFKDFPIVEAGHRIPDDVTIFSETLFTVIHRKFNLTGHYLLNGDESMKKDFSVEVYLDNFDTSKIHKNKWQLGIEISKSNVLSFILKDERGNVQKCLLKNIFNQS